MQDKTDAVKYLQRLTKGITITKIVATRNLRTPHGDYFLAYSGAYDSHQCDYGGPGADAVPDAAEDREVAGSGYGLPDAKIVKMILAREVDMGVLDSAHLGGAISTQEYENQRKAITHRYNKEIGRLLKVTAPPPATSTNEGMDTDHVGS